MCQSTHPMLYCLGCMSSLFLGIIMLKDVNNSHKIDLLSGRIWGKNLHSSFMKTELTTNFHNVTYYRNHILSKKKVGCVLAYQTRSDWIVEGAHFVPK